MSYTQKIEKGYLQQGKKIDFKHDIPECTGLNRFTDMTRGVLGKIYFAHPESRWQTKREEMISKILTKRGYDVVNPFDGEEALLKKHNAGRYYKNPSKPLSDEIVEKDYQMVMECDSYFGWFPKKSMATGTAIEMEWAYNAGKRIIVLIWKPQPFCWNRCDVMYLGYNNFKNDVRFYDKAILRAVR